MTWTWLRSMARVAWVKCTSSSVTEWIDVIDELNEALAGIEMDERSRDNSRNLVYATIADVVASNGIFTDGDWVETKDQDLNGVFDLYN